MPGQYPPPPPPPKKGGPFTSKPAWAAYAGVLGLFLGAAMGGAGSAPTTSAEPAPAATVTETAPVEPGPTVTVTAKAPEQKAAPKPKPAAKTFGDGDYLVGSEIPRGTYKSSGVEEDGLCYADTQTKGGDILEQVVKDKGVAIIRIQGKAYTFTTKDCGEWHKVG